MNKVTALKTEQVYGAANQRINKQVNSDIRWWKEARFGMFIHWGLYSKLAGYWKEQKIERLGEWIMSFANISVEEYREVAKEFNPLKYNANEWVKLMKDAGMKYVVITAKHHDGFAMYHSKSCDYNIYDATPFKRDPLKELSEACRKNDVKFCVYYSHVIDFYHPHGERNDFAHPYRGERDFQKYLDERCIPQLTELLTEYGEVGCIWFDMPSGITKEQAEDIRNLVKKLQPNCIIEGRLGFDYEDTVCMGDNEIPQRAYEFPWETPGTINHTWGYKEYDKDWRDTGSLLRLLVDICSKGGNYLLNVGPTAEGIIPEESVIRLQEIGQWLKINGESIYGTKGYYSPSSRSFEWGTITCKEDKLYVHVYDWKKEILIHGIKNKVLVASLLSNGEKVGFSQCQAQGLDYSIITLQLGKDAPDKYISVIKLELDGCIDVFKELTQAPDKSIYLQAAYANIQRASKNSQLTIGNMELTHNWFNVDDWLSWEFHCIEAGEYEVDLVTFMEKYERCWEGGHEFEILVNGQKLDFIVENHESYYRRGVYYYKNILTRCGKISLEKPGKYEIILKPKKLVNELELGPKVSEIILKKL